MTAQIRRQADRYENRLAPGLFNDTRVRRRTEQQPWQEQLAVISCRWSVPRLASTTPYWLRLGVAGGAAPNVARSSLDAAKNKNEAAGL